MKLITVIKKKVSPQGKVYYINTDYRSEISKRRILDLKWPIVIVNQAGHNITKSEVNSMIEEELVKEGIL